MAKCALHIRELAGATVQRVPQQAPSCPGVTKDVVMLTVAGPLRCKKNAVPQTEGRGIFAYTRV